MIIVEPQFIEAILDYCHEHSDNKELIDRAAMNYNSLLKHINAMGKGDDYDYYEALDQLLTLLCLSWESIVGETVEAHAPRTDYFLLPNK
jgi:hypothetical protein